MCQLALFSYKTCCISSDNRFCCLFVKLWSCISLFFAPSAGADDRRTSMPGSFKAGKIPGIEYIKLKIAPIPLLALFFSIFIATHNSYAQSNDTAFAPTWKMLSPAAKQQFVSGYLFALRDAERITDIAVDFVRKNPDVAIESLERIKQLYKVKGSNPAEIAAKIDSFYSQPENASASLSLAINSNR